MSLLFLWLKATRMVETDFDWPIGLLLAALDLCWSGPWLRQGLSTYRETR